jgi:hypothetical protein
VRQDGRFVLPGVGGFAQLVGTAPGDGDAASLARQRDGDSLTMPVARP